MSSSIITYRINNLCKKVSDILNKFLSEPKTSTASSSSNGNYVPLTRNPFYRGLPSSCGREYLKGVLRFYEWSDLYRAPVLFYTLEDFIVFLRRSNIVITDIERNLLLQTHNPFVTCEEGKAKLIIRASSADLKLALDVAKKFSSDDNDKSKDKGGFVLPGIRNLGTEPDCNEAKTPIKPYSGEYVGEWFENR